MAFVIVNEAGASVYSTSPVGREELPHYDAVLRSAISIGRRLLDPLSELVKINPANIGVGMYQHDVKAKHLRNSLDAVVESCVNYVGVDVNTASPALLRYVSGMNQLTARRLCEYRSKHGPFRSREQLKQVSGLGEATFVQAAGFLKIRHGDNPLDATWIHPESYELASQVLAKAGCSVADLVDRLHTGGAPPRSPPCRHRARESRPRAEHPVEPTRPVRHRCSAGRREVAPVSEACTRRRATPAPKLHRCRRQQPSRSYTPPRKLRPEHAARSRAGGETSVTDAVEPVRARRRRSDVGATSCAEAAEPVERLWPRAPRRPLRFVQEQVRQSGSPSAGGRAVGERTAAARHPELAGASGSRSPRRPAGPRVSSRDRQARGPRSRA